MNIVYEIVTGKRAVDEATEAPTQNTVALRWADALRRPAGRSRGPG